MLTHRMACWIAPHQTRCLHLGGDLFIHVSFGQLFNYKWEEMFTHFQVWLPVRSENMSAVISMWLESTTRIQPTPLMCPWFQVLFRVDVPVDCITMVVICAFIERHTIQGYIHVLSKFWRSRWRHHVDDGSHVNYLNNSNVISALSELQYDRDRAGGSSYFLNMNNSVGRHLREKKSCVMSTLCCFSSPPLFSFFKDLDGCKSWACCFSWLCLMYSLFLRIFRGRLGQLHGFWEITQIPPAPRVSSVISLLSVVRKGLPSPVIISWKHFTSFRNLGCRLHASSWWPVDYVGHLWTVSNFWRKLKHLAFTYIMLKCMYCYIVRGSPCPRSTLFICS